MGSASLQQSQTPEPSAGSIRSLPLPIPESPGNHLGVNADGLLPQTDQPHPTPHHGPSLQGRPASGGGSPFQVGPIELKGQLPLSPGVNGAGRSTPQVQRSVALNFALVLDVAQQLLSSIAPLEHALFDRAFKNWCLRKNVQVDFDSLEIDGQRVNLFSLHQTVFQEGGFRKVGSPKTFVSRIGADNLN